MLPPEEQITDILIHFDFDRVHRAMKALNWGWGNKNEVPEIEDIKLCAVRLLRDVAKKKCRLSATGGFEATSDEDGALGLKFVVSDWHYYDSNLPED